MSELHKSCESTTTNQQLVQVKNRFTGEVICSGETIAKAVESYADLRYANLGYANLRYANLSSANLSYADLRSAKISWSSHDLISEILKRSAGDDIAKLKVAGLILVCREKCWSEFLSICDPLSEWAIDVLRGWIVDGDDHPKCLDAGDES